LFHASFYEPLSDAFYLSNSYASGALIFF